MDLSHWRGLLDFWRRMKIKMAFDIIDFDIDNFSVSITIAE